MYIIKKDGMYLIGYHPSGLTEYDRDGRPQQVFTCVWSNNKHDAMPFDNRAFAEVFSDMIDGQVIQVVMKG